MFGSFTEPFNYFLPISTKLRVWKLSKMLNNGAMASYLVFIVLRKETAFPRCRAMDRHGSRNTVSLVSWMMTWLWCICQYPGITQIAMSSGVPAVSMAMAMFLWHVCRCQLGILGSLVLLLLSSSLSEYIYIFLFVCLWSFWIFVRTEKYVYRSCIHLLTTHRVESCRPNDGIRHKMFGEEPRTLFDNEHVVMCYQQNLASVLMEIFQVDQG